MAHAIRVSRTCPFCHDQIIFGHAPAQRYPLHSRRFCGGPNPLRHSRDASIASLRIRACKGGTGHMPGASVLETLHLTSRLCAGCRCER